MSKMIRTARGELVDFELLAIKQQLASMKPPKPVEERKQAIAIKDGAKQPSVEVADVDFLGMAVESANISSTAPGKQLKRK